MMPPFDPELDKLITDEINVKQLNRYLGMTERGRLCMVYTAATGKYHITLNGAEIKAPKLLAKLSKS